MRERPRFAEVIAVLSMATDLGLGLPLEHTVRTCLLSVEIGRRAGMSPPELADVYYLTLLRMLGCTADSAGQAGFLGDEVAFSRDTQHLDYGDQAAFGRWVMESFAIDRPAAERQAMLGRLFSYTPQTRAANLAGHCEVAQMLAARLGFTGAVPEGLACVFERWDGTGAPNGVAGADLPAGVRVMTLANEIEAHHRLGGPQAAVAMARQRSGRAFDPDLVEMFCADIDAILAVIGRPSARADLLLAEPAPHRVATEAELLEAARVMADFADMKSAFLAGHSTEVADLATRAAERMRLDAAGRLALTVGALAHDLGRVAVTAAIWDKPGPLNDSEWEKVRLHPYYSERLLARVPTLAGAARIAGSHHERGDGSGYHRGSGSAEQPAPGCLVAAADVYVAMRQARAFRPALDPDRAGTELRKLAVGGLLDTHAVNAVLAAAGNTGPAVRRKWPAGLTDREVDVLREAAKGGSIQQVAAGLHLAPKTVDFHLQNIYAKAQVTTRAGATLFAIQNGLLQP